MAAQGLSRWGVIGVQGEDAVAFLQAQLSNDVAGMGESQLRMAALCTAKGRMLGSFFMLRHASDVYLVCRRETIPALVKRLTMFVLRSKCKIRDCSGEYQLAFVVNSGLSASMKVNWQENGNAIASLRKLNDRLPGFELQQAPAETVEGSADDEFEFVLQQLGIAFVSGATVEMFIPQAVNFDLVGGVSFSKGCYPGQEIVARSHYLGKVKRRVFQATAPVGLGIAAGLDVWLAGKDNEPVGQVATALQLDGQQHLLVELPVEDAENQQSVFTVKLDDVGVQLSIQAPPYDVHQKGNLFEIA
jgi:tRNA-modifying protein YgfZ